MLTALNAIPYESWNEQSIKLVSSPGEFVFKMSIPAFSESFYPAFSNSTPFIKALPLKKYKHRQLWIHNDIRIRGGGLKLSKKSTFN